MTAPADKPRRAIVRSCPVEALGKAPRNPNVLSPAMRVKLGRAIEAFGFLQPILVRRLPTADLVENLETPEAQEVISRLGVKSFEIIDGHHRAEEAIAQGATEVPIIVIDCTPEQALIIAMEMNRLHGELDLSLVAANFAELSAAGMTTEQMTLSAFDQDEIDALLKSLAAPDASEEIMNGGAGQNDEPEDRPDRPFELSLTFKTADMLKRVKRSLRKAAGGGRKADLTRGLLTALGLDDEGQG